MSSSTPCLFIHHMNRKWKTLIQCMAFLGSISLFAQNAIVKGRVVDTHSSDAVSNASVAIQDDNYITSTNDEGLFNSAPVGLPQGEQILVITKDGYLSQRIRITIQDGITIDLNPILLQPDLNDVEAQIGIIGLSDSELDLDEATSYNVSGLLSASKDVFLNAAAFDFSTTFFRPRGLDNANGKVLINGIEMNKLYNGRPQWGNWGGLNDVQRNREFSMALKANGYTFGGIAGTTNMMMRASKYRKGGRVSFASSNRTYRGRVMGSYHSGMTKRGWAFSLLFARRYGDEGYQEGTLYDANSFFASVEKKLDKTHSVNLTAFFTPNRRGRSTALTKEVYDLKGGAYNPNWGYQEDEKRSSRIRDIQEPVIMLNHYWKIGESSMLNTNVSYQFGKIGDTRLDYGVGKNPAGNYYQRLPSYFLRNTTPSTYDFELAYRAEQEFIDDGQIDWALLYSANANNNSIYSIQEDRVDDIQLAFNSILNVPISENITIDGNMNYRKLKSENFAELKDLLGGNGYLDVDNFGDGGIASNSDIQNPNRVVQEGDRYKYNYVLDASVISGFAQAQFKYNKTDFYLGLSGSQTNYQRTGLYKNGYFPEKNRSLGSSEKASFTNFGVKGDATYKLTGRHFIKLNAGYISKPPSLRASFANARQNNDLVVGLESEKIQAADISYIFRSPIIKARLTGYYINLQSQTEIGFFFTQNALGNEETSAFVQEIVTGIDKRNIGAELGIEVQVTPTLKLKSAAAFGQNVYTNNPNLYLAGDDFGTEGNDISTLGIREVMLKNYHVSGGPERAYQLGFEYRDPNFWWVGVTTNYFSNAYVDVSNLRRTVDFYTDVDGQPFNDYNEDIARQVLRQEKLEDYFLVNIVGGKSWRIKRYYLGFFVTVNNILNQDYVTGGFEDSRRASYRQQVEEQNRDQPIFGNRYFFGNGTTYYANIYVRF